MKGLYEMREALCKVTEEYARKGDLSPGSVDLVDKALNAIKNTYKIEMFENQGGGFGRGGSYDSYGDDSYRRNSYGNRDSYADSYNSYGDSYDNGNSGRRGYSRDSGKEMMVRKMEEMLRYVDSEEQRKAVERCIHQLKEG